MKNDYIERLRQGAREDAEAAGPHAKDYSTRLIQVMLLAEIALRLPEPKEKADSHTPEKPDA